MHKKTRTHYETGKTKIEKLSLQHQEFYEKVSASLNFQQQFKSHLDEVNTLLTRMKADLPQEHLVLANNAVDDLKQRVQAICQDVSKCITRYEEHKLFVTSVVSLVTANKESNAKILTE